MRELPQIRARLLGLLRIRGADPALCDVPATGGRVSLQSERLALMREQPNTRRARLVREQRAAKRQRRAAKRQRMHQLTLPHLLRQINIEWMLHGHLLEQMAAVLVKIDERQPFSFRGSAA